LEDLVSKAPDPTDRHVGPRIRMRRLMLDLSQTALADALGVAFQQVQKYEKGTNRIAPSRLQPLANLLQVPVSFFFEGLQHVGKTKLQGTTDSSNPYTEFLATAEGVALTKAFMQISSASIRRSIVQLVQHIAAVEREH
jgi:transcriptional regulator with XRE-family HTH domain